MKRAPVAEKHEKCYCDHCHLIIADGDKTAIHTGNNDLHKACSRPFHLRKEYGNGSQGGMLQLP